MLACQGKAQMRRRNLHGRVSTEMCIRDRCCCTGITKHRWYLWMCGWNGYWLSCTPTAFPSSLLPGWELPSSICFTMRAVTPQIFASFLQYRCNFLFLHHRQSKALQSHEMRISEWRRNRRAQTDWYLFQGQCCYDWKRELASMIKGDRNRIIR